MKKEHVGYFNCGFWPKQVFWMEFVFLPFMGRWHLVEIECSNYRGEALGRWPRWAITPGQQSEIDAAARQLPDLPHPDKDR